MIYVRLSAGIGAGIITAGRLLVGTGGLAGEIGHVPVAQAGRVCRCGNRGCLETVASPVAIARLLQDSWGRAVTPDDLPRLFAGKSMEHCAWSRMPPRQSGAPWPGWSRSSTRR